MALTETLKVRPSIFNLKGTLKTVFKRMALHPFSLRFAIGLWAGSSLALYLAFLFQFETPQWAGVSVWIMFMQSPRLNYSKVIFWLAGTLSGAVMATFLIISLSQTPEIFLLSLSLWLALCAALATQLREYRAYGAVLAGYTAAIVSFTAVNQPDRVFEIAVTRVSCVALGIACAVFAMTVFLPRHLHWRQTLQHLNEHCRRILLQAIAALGSRTSRTNPGSWRHVVERLSTLEHAFDFTLAESADARSRSAQARSLTATLFCFAAKAQSVEFHLLHAAENHSLEARDCLEKTWKLIEKGASQSGQALCVSLMDEIAALRNEIGILHDRPTGEFPGEISDRFLLDQLNGILFDLDHVLRDQAGLYGLWSAPRPSCLSLHRDSLMGWLYALRIFLAMGLATTFWFATEWPSGASFLLFLAIVCSLLSLLDHAEKLGMAFLKSVAGCFAASFIELFWVLQKGEGFLFFCGALGLFLVPAAYAYTHPRLSGSAVISMLLFYGLVAPANSMTYDIGIFLNNACAFLAAAAFGFFSFHVVSSPVPATRQRMLVRAMRMDLRHVPDWKGPLREQRWTSLAFDRMRILHRFGSEQNLAQLVTREIELRDGLLWGLRQIGLRKFVEEKRGGVEAIQAVKRMLRLSRNSFQHPLAVSAEISRTMFTLRKVMHQGNDSSQKAVFKVLAELQEMSFFFQPTQVKA